MIDGPIPLQRNDSGAADSVAAQQVPGTGLIHFAGIDVQVGPFLRQRCSWCGAVLIDYNLDRVAVPIGQDPRPATWPISALVEVDGNASWTVEHVDGDPLPAGTCAHVDPDATL